MAEAVILEAAATAPENDAPSVPGAVTSKGDPAVVEEKHAVSAGDGRTPNADEKTSEADEATSTAAPGKAATGATAAANAASSGGNTSALASRHAITVQDAEALADRRVRASNARTAGENAGAPAADEASLEGNGRPLEADAGVMRGDHDMLAAGFGAA